VTVPPRIQGESTELPSAVSGFLDDIHVPGALHAAFVRSPLPHARITSIDVSAARAMGGVAAVLIADDMRDIAFQSTPPPGAPPLEFGPLAQDRVRFAGDPISIVVAESRRLAESAVELVEVDYDPLPAVASIEQALDATLPPLWETYESNVVWRDRRTYGDIDNMFASADRILSFSFDSPRVGHAPMECGGCIATFRSNRADIWIGTQSPNAVRSAVARAFRIPMSGVRVRTPRIGGSFGQKGQYRREDLAVVCAARATDAPIKWVEDRFENLLAAGQAREERLIVDAAIDGSGHLLGLRVSILLDQGAYPGPWPRSVTIQQIRTLFPSAYRLGALDFEATILASNKASYLPYRGPWSAETWVRERVLDVIAAEIGVEPIEVRRRNLVEKTDQPQQMITGPTLSGISLRQGLDLVEQFFDFESFRVRQSRERSSGRLLGIGLACYLEPAPGPPDYSTSLRGIVDESPSRQRTPMGGKPAKARLELDGSVTIAVAESASGQDHRAAFAQVAAEVLSVDPSRISILTGDTDVIPFTPYGTGGSAAAHMTGGAVRAATAEIAAKLRRICSHLLEANPDDLEIGHECVFVRGSRSRAVTFAEAAATAWLLPERLPPGEEPGFEVMTWFANQECGWSQGTHLCEVEVEASTGLVAVTRYLVVEDCGRVINPASVAGQIRGGVTQGIGMVLYEHAAFDDDGNPLAASFMDYLLPTACEIPPIEIVHIDNQAGVPSADVTSRGVGEGGTIGSTAAVLNAVADAVGGGNCVSSRLLPPSTIWSILRERAVLSGESKNVGRT
jgi:aerobic carbon-monoxide dehydrogenase large subunit